jgi:hypothetical protein
MGIDQRAYFDLWLQLQDRPLSIEPLISNSAFFVVSAGWIYGNRWPRWAGDRYSLV